MSNENMWPDITADESTKCVFELFNELETQLKAKYDGKIQCQLEATVYKTQGFVSAVQRYHDIVESMTAPIETETGVEEGKEPVHIKSPTECKFIIYDERHFFRILDVKLGEYFPIEIRQARGISPNQDYKYVTVESGAEFRRVVSDCINSSYVKDVIRYMLKSKGS